MDKSECRAIVDKIVDPLARVLNLGDWNLDITFGPCDEGMEARAQTNTSLFHYRRALITIDPERMDDAADVAESVRHELIHVFHAPFFAFVRQARNFAGNDREHDVLTTDMTASAEALCRNMEMFIDRAFPAPPPPKPKRRVAKKRK